MRWLWPALLPLAASTVARGPETALAAALAALLAAALAREVTGSRRLALWAGLLAPAVVLSPAAGLAGSAVLGLLWARARGADPWWSLALVPLALLSGAIPLPTFLAPLAPSPAWSWAAALAPALLASAAGARHLLGAALAALVLLPLAPAYALTGLGVALVVRLAWIHPANRSWATGSERAATVLAMLPGILLLLVAVGGGIAAGAPFAVLRLGWIALFVGLLLLAALRGSSFLFLASDAAAPHLLAATWSAWTLAALGTLADWPRIGLSLLGAAGIATSAIIVLGLHTFLSADRKTATTWTLATVATVAALL